MQEWILAMFVGLLVGAFFSGLNLPIPAPPALSGVMGIVGIYLGYKLIESSTEHWDEILTLLPV